MTELDESEARPPALGKFDAAGAPQWNLLAGATLFEEDAFMLPRDAYARSFTVDWDEPPPVSVYSNENDNRRAWPLIVAFTDAVVEKLGGEWVET